MPKLGRPALVAGHAGPAGGAVLGWLLEFTAYRRLRERSALRVLVLIGHRRQPDDGQPFTLIFGGALPSASWCRGLAHRQRLARAPGRDTGLLACAQSSGVGAAAHAGGDGDVPRHTISDRRADGVDANQLAMLVFGMSGVLAGLAGIMVGGYAVYPIWGSSPSRL